MSVDLDPNGDLWRATVTRTYDYELALLPHGTLFDRPDLADACGRETGRAFVVLDAGVAEALTPRLTRYFAAQRMSATIHEIPAGDASKRPEVVDRVISALLGWTIQRTGERVLVVGGGAAADAGGFAASQVLRGVEWAYVPTTMVGMADTGQGGKVAANDPEHGKNKRGGFHPASVRLLDPAFLATLPRAEIANGLAEVLKVGLMLSDELTALLAAHGREILHSECTSPHTVTLLRETTNAIFPTLAADLFETELARLLDFGHTTAHEEERTSGGREPHGGAVAHDIAVSTCLAHLRGRISDARRDFVLSLLPKLGLSPWSEHFDESLFARAIADRTAHRGGSLRMVIPREQAGGEFVNDVTPENLVEARTALAAHLGLPTAQG